MFLPWLAIVILAVLLVGLYAISSGHTGDIDELRERVEDLEAKPESEEGPTTAEIDAYIDSRAYEFLAGRGENPGDIPHNEMRADILRQRKAG